jgi:hypothetical protein
VLANINKEHFRCPSITKFNPIRAVVLEIIHAGRRQELIFRPDPASCKIGRGFLSRGLALTAHPRLALRLTKE